MFRNKKCDMKFVVPSHYELRNTRSWLDENGVNWRSLGNTCWFTSFNVRENDWLKIESIEVIGNIYDNKELLK